jgi:hypothetical protein
MNLRTTEADVRLILDGLEALAVRRFPIRRCADPRR